MKPAQGISPHAGGQALACELGESTGPWGREREGAVVRMVQREVLRTISPIRISGRKIRRNHITRGKAHAMTTTNDNADIRFITSERRNRSRNRCFLFCSSRISRDSSLQLNESGSVLVSSESDSLLAFELMSVFAGFLGKVHQKPIMDSAKMTPHTHIGVPNFTSKMTPPASNADSRNRKFAYDFRHIYTFYNLPDLWSIVGLPLLRHPLWETGTSSISSKHLG